MIRSHIINQFMSFITRYDLTDTMISRKLVHTLRVADLCDEIAASIEMNDTERNISWICGMLHDIGRFEQARIYHTYNDSISESHAGLSVKILYSNQIKEKGMIRVFLPDNDDYDEAISFAIGHHSRYQISESIRKSPYFKFLAVLRDADKIDNLSILADYSSDEMIGMPPYELQRQGMSMIALNAFKERRCLNNRIEKIKPADKIISTLAFIFELEYDESLEIAIRRNYVDRLITTPFGIENGLIMDEDSDKIWNDVKSECLKYIEERLGRLNN